MRSFLARFEGPPGLVPLPERAGELEIERVRVAPGSDRNENVVHEGSVKRALEVEQRAQRPISPEDVIAEEVAVDDAGGKLRLARGPVALE